MVMRVLIGLIRQLFLNTYLILSPCVFLQFRLVPKVNPINLNSSTLSTFTSSSLSVRACIRLLGIWKTIYLVLLFFNNNLLIFCYSLI